MRIGILKQIKNERRIDREFGTPSYRRKKGIEVHNGIRGLDKITLAGKVYDIQKLRIDVLEGWE